MSVDFNIRVKFYGDVYVNHSKFVGVEHWWF